MQLVELQRDKDQFASEGAKVVAVSTDSLQVSTSVTRQLGLDYPILVDRPNGLGAAFGVFQGSGHMGSTDEHSMFVIDASGVVRWKQISPSMHVAMSDVLDAVKAT